MKTVLGLDLGTNSIGGALVKIGSLDQYGKEGKIEWLGSRIIPVDGEMLQKFECGGMVVTKAAARTKARSARRLKHRYTLRRARLIEVFKVLGWVPDDFPEDFKQRMEEDPNYKFHINNYLPFDETTIDEALSEFGIKRKKDGTLPISPDWIVYYLRKKALSKKITLKELARILYMMNQRRGFKSSRKDLRETTVLSYDEFIKVHERIKAGHSPEYAEGKGEALETKFVSISKIKSVKQDGKETDSKGNFSFTITASDPRLEPWVEKRKKKPEWEGKEFKLVVTQKVDKKGKLTQLKPQTPQEGDWELAMVALDNQIDAEQKHPGEFFLGKLVEDKNYRIRQTAVRREKYEKELKAIWDKQAEAFLPELKDKSKLYQIAQVLYPTQTREKKEKLKDILSHDLFHVFANDIIYYQRELRSQKKLVGGCQFEYHTYKKAGNERKSRVKVAPISSPEFQEFRIWQDIHNLRIIQKERLVDGRPQFDVDVTKDFIDESTKGVLFDLFDSSSEIDQSDIFKKLNECRHEKALSEETHTINLITPYRKALKGNETKQQFRRVFKKHGFDEEGSKLLADKIKFYKLWHIIYSISSSKKEISDKGIRSALGNPKHDFNLPPAVIDDLAKLPELPKKYAALSSKAINKLLTVMRCGAKWSWEAIPAQTRERIEDIRSNGWDFEIDKKTGEFIEKRQFREREQFQGLPVWMACYVVYGRHSERESNEKYSDNGGYQQIDVMKLVPHNSLRNPIVEQIVRETLRLVKDVWKQYGRPDEIHIELARDLKKNAEERSRIAERNSANFSEKQRIKQLLYELMNGDFEEYSDHQKVTSHFEVDPNPESPADIEKFRIWKSLGENNIDDERRKELFEFFRTDDRKRTPTGREIRKYALWLSQKCISPYTGKVIPISKLFTHEYQVEHIIPQSKLKDDSFENLVICEVALNPEPYKGNKLARHFIRQFSGQTLRIGGIEYTILEEEAYVEHCKKTFRGRKRANLLREDVPDEFISRQINDTRYISRKLNELLYPIARDKEGLVFTIGSITGDLRAQWGLNRVWKELLRPRFERLEKITGKKLIFRDEKDANKFHYNVPENPRLNEKRIDHRHHALDALIVATTTREHIRYLNSLNAVDSKNELREIKLRLVKRKISGFALPWPAFAKDAKDKLNEVVCSVKSNNRLVTRPDNRYLKWVQNPKGEWVKELVEQTPPQDATAKWLAIRKSMFKEPLGIIYLKQIREVKPLRAIELEILRQKAVGTIDAKTSSYVYDKDARIQIKEVIKQHGADLEAIKRALKKVPLTNSKGKAIVTVRVAEFVAYAAKRVAIDKSFTHDKIDKIPYAEKSLLARILHAHLKAHKDKPEEAFQGEGLEMLEKKNGGRPIKKVTIYEEVGNKEEFKGRLVEVDKGSNLYFVIYEHLGTTERKQMFTLPLLDAINRLANRSPLADALPEHKVIVLSPSDLVFVPREEEHMDPRLIPWQRYESDPAARAAWMLLANLKIGLHEQTRLQPQIAEAIDAPLVTAEDLGGRVLHKLIPGAERWYEWIRKPSAAAIGWLAARIRNAAVKITREIVTEAMMVLRLPDVVLALGKNLDAPVPPVFAGTPHPVLAGFLREYETCPAGTSDCGARDWADLRQRMHYILHLFRAYAEEASLFSKPFADAQVAQFRKGVVPGGVL
ncbi:MAG: hypothetical protein KF749_14255 [Bacteroidetes bacterium]|nr:hypothetical protein [Bacteroidota bacterium]MCW5894081.1 hypothetical protein [Bacteroidota bacterium]